MKIITIFGTRPELIRLSLVLKILDEYTVNITVHTGQNFDYELDKVFFENLNIREPNYYLGSTGSFVNQISNSFVKFEKILKKEKPDKLLVLGDTNSSLTSIIAKRLKIPIYHIEAGNRCLNPNSPEEINRKIIDHCSDIHMVYSNRSFNNLKDEGINQKSIFLLGNPIYEVLKHYNSKILSSKILSKLKINKNKFSLLTLHREENVDDLAKLKKILIFLTEVCKKQNLKLIWPIHPRSLINFKKIPNVSNSIKVIKPLGFFDYIKLQLNSKIIFTDSGTVQEECAILRKPSIILRDSTERDETLEKGSGILINNFDKDINKKINFIIKNKNFIDTPNEYLIENVSFKIVNLLMNDFKILK